MMGAGGEGSGASAPTVAVPPNASTATALSAHRSPLSPGRPSPGPSTDRGGAAGSRGNSPPPPVPGHGGNGGHLSCAELASDERFAPFVVETFNPAEFTSTALAGSHITAQAQAAQLQDGIEVLRGTLRDEVGEKQTSLLKHAKGLVDTGKSLASIQLSVASLQTALQRVRAEIMEPYEAVQVKARQLRNLHTTIDKLRNVILMLKLTAKLRSQLASTGGPIDLAKAAKVLSDIKALAATADLSGIACIDADKEFLAEAGTKIREQAEAALLAGMEALNQAEVGSALQVYFNLGELKDAVKDLLGRYCTDIELAVHAALDARTYAATGAAGFAGGGKGGAGSPQEQLWGRLDAVVEQMHGAAVAVWHMQRVLAKKKDPLTHVCFGDLLMGEGQPALSTRFWRRLSRALSDRMAAAAAPTRGGFLREALTTNYPRLASRLEKMLARLERNTDVRGTRPAARPEEQDLLLEATAPFRSQYIAAASARLSDAASAAFPGAVARGAPSTADLQRLISRLHEELKVAADSPRLATQVALAAGGALRLAAERADLMAASGAELRALRGGATAAQARNVALCSHLYEAHRAMGMALARLPAEAGAALAEPMDAVAGAAVEVVAPTFKAAVSRAEEIIASMHESPGYGGEEGWQAAKLGEQPPPSGWVTELAALLGYFRGELLMQFSPAPSPTIPSFAGALTQRMASRLLVVAARHASLARPLSRAGGTQLARDLAEVEAAVGAHLWPLEHLGGTARLARSFRPLLTLDVAAVAASPCLADLPPTVVLNHLFARAPVELASPRERSGLTHAQYSLWLDTHSGADAVGAVRDALDAASSSVPAEDPVAKLMRSLCEAALS